MKQLEILDPLVVDLATAGAEDAQYVCMLNDIENSVQGKDLDEASELKSIQGMLGELCVTVLPEGNPMVVRNGVEILVPLGERRRILETLHLDHTCDETMIRQCNGRVTLYREK